MRSMRDRITLTFDIFGWMLKAMWNGFLVLCVVHGNFSFDLTESSKKMELAEVIKKQNALAAIIIMWLIDQQIPTNEWASESSNTCTHGYCLIKGKSTNSIDSNLLPFVRHFFLENTLCTQNSKA